MSQETTSWTAFRGQSRLVGGDAREVTAAVRQLLTEEGQASVLVFDDATGRQVDVDQRELTEVADAPVEARAPGRPRLGVVAREVTLLPRHWEWLNAQPGGASVALRRLVDFARAANSKDDAVRQARETADRFIGVMAGNLPGYEEATRALYRGERSGFTAHTENWPADIRDHARRLADAAFD